MTDQDLIRRGDARKALERLTRSREIIGGQAFHKVQLGEAETAIRALPAVQPAPVPDDVAALVGALTQIDALDPEGMIAGCSEHALRGLVLRMGEIARLDAPAPQDKVRDAARVLADALARGELPMEMVQYLNDGYPLLALCQIASLNP